MKTGRHGVAAAIVLALATGTGWCAGDKTATLDFERVMKEYYKTPPAEAEMERQGNEVKAELTRMTDRLGKMEQEFTDARTEAANKALSEDALKEKRELAEKKLTEAKEYEQEVRKFLDAQRKRLTEDRMRVLRRFSDDIRNVVNKYAQDKGIKLVLDSSTPAQALAGSVIYAAENLDITDAILEILNSGAADKKKKE